MECSQVFIAFFSRFLFCLCVFSLSNKFKKKCKRGCDKKKRKAYKNRLNVASVLIHFSRLLFSSTCFIHFISFKMNALYHVQWHFAYTLLPFPKPTIVLFVSFQIRFDQLETVFTNDVTVTVTVTIHSSARLTHARTDIPMTTSTRQLR